MPATGCLTLTTPPISSGTGRNSTGFLHLQLLRDQQRNLADRQIAVTQVETVNQRPGIILGDFWQFGQERVFRSPNRCTGDDVSRTYGPERHLRPKILAPRRTPPTAKAVGMPTPSNGAGASCLKLPLPL
jgi:hypothetical protein